MQGNWQQELGLLKSIIRKTELVETIKWGIEVYTYKGKNVVGVAGFKNFFTLWFYNGVFLKDHQHVLINAQDGKTKGLRQWRFNSINDINEDLILEYIYEAVRNQDEGKELKADRVERVDPTQFLTIVFEGDEMLRLAFEKLSPSKQKEYNDFIQSAKREETKKARLEKIKPLIMEGKGLHDKYKNR